MFNTAARIILSPIVFAFFLVASFFVVILVTYRYILNGGEFITYDYGQKEKIRKVYKIIEEQTLKNETK